MKVEFVSAVDLFKFDNMKRTVNIEIDDELLSTLKVSEQNLPHILKRLLAMALYQSRKVSIGRAAAIAGMKRGEFEDFLFDNGIPNCNLTVEDIDKEIALIRTFE